MTAGGALAGRVALITGAGRGLGREHALLFAREGAKVIVNDADAGSGGASDPAEEVVAEIRRLGGEAIANSDDASDWDGARAAVEQGIEAFGEIDILVNNAGILRDRALVKLSEEDWDTVVRVHLKGHVAPARHLAAHWRQRTKEGAVRPRAMVNTSSGSGLFGTPGQTNYAAAKAGILTLTLVWAAELERYGARVNAIAPIALTRLTAATPELAAVLAPSGNGEANLWEPANVSPLVAYLASEACQFNGHVFYAQGMQVALMQGYGVNQAFSRDERWDVASLAAALGPFADQSAVGYREPLLAYRGASEARRDS